MQGRLRDVHEACERGDRAEAQRLPAGRASVAKGAREGRLIFHLEYRNAILK